MLHFIVLISIGRQKRTLSTYLERMDMWQPPSPTQKHHGINYQNEMLQYAAGTCEFVSPSLQHRNCGNKQHARATVELEYCTYFQAWGLILEDFELGRETMGDCHIHRVGTFIEATPHSLIHNFKLQASAFMNRLMAAKNTTKNSRLFQVDLYFHQKQHAVLMIKQIWKPFGKPL